MDLILLIIVTILLIWLGTSLVRHQFKDIPRTHIPTIPNKSPYQKLVEEKQMGWQLARQNKDLLKRKDLLVEAIEKKDKTQVKVQKSMISFSKSLVNHMRTKNNT